jgi:hypothetical protein
VGFGIGTPGQAAAVGRAADGVIVGSAIVQLVERHGGSEELVGRVGDFVASLKEPLKASTRMTSPGHRQHVGECGGHVGVPADKRMHGLASASTRARS